MSLSTAVAELVPASDKSAPGMAPPPTGVYKLHRQLQIAGVEAVVSNEVAPGTYILIDDHHDGDGYWIELWKQRDDNLVHTAFADVVVPQCPLLSSEVATAILPSLGLQVPAESAWVTMRVELTRFLRTDGTLDRGALRRALDTCVDVGEELHDVTAWSTADMRRDAWLNRRLGITVTGFGELLRLRRMDPCSHHSLRFLNQLLIQIRETLQTRSRAIARRSEQLPAISLSDPSHRLPSGGVRDDWRRRWQQAVQASLVRHRNLLVISPWSLFPADSMADFRYAELLPLLRHADACAFNKTVSIAHWNVKEFKCFHQRARAMLRQRFATPLIAKHV